MRNGYVFLIALGILLGTVSTMNIPSAHGLIYGINKVQSGFAASDPLNKTQTQQQLQADNTYWTYGGDAIAEKAPYGFSEDSNGLHIGVQAPTNGTYAGFYAVTPITNATLAHAIISVPVRTIPSNNNYYNNGLYVQTSQAPVNYVTCAAITNKFGTIWAVLHTYGSPDGSLVFDTLKFDDTPNQPLTRDCIIITNGENYLKVYLDHVLFYSSNSLALAMPSPFNFFLEPQSSYAGQMINGTFLDYYSAFDENIKITGAPSNAARVDVIDSSGRVLSSGPFLLGTATVDVGKYHFPLSANIIVYDSSNSPIASTPYLVHIYGGDAYTVSNTPVFFAPQNLQATAGTRNITIAWQAPSSNGGSAITGYKVYRSTSSGTETGYVNLGNVTSYTNTIVTPGVTYFYKVRAVNSVGLSPLSNEASATPPTVPTAPQNLQASAGVGNVTLSWQAPSSDGGSAITGYKVYRSTSSGTETGYVILGNVNSYTNTGLTGGTTYFYKVRAVNSAGLSPLSNEASATPPALPSAPQNLQAAVGKSITISWQTPSSDGGSAITGYKVYRSTSSGTETGYVNLGNVTSYTNTGLTPGVTYFYKVRAVNSAGLSPLSNEASATAI